MPNRSFSASALYRYGFNGKENDNEVNGTGAEQDYGKRILDPRLGRFLSVDPLQTKFPFYTPYQYAGNRPIEAIDLDGLEPVSSNDMLIRQNAGTTKWNQNVEYVYDPAKQQWFSVMSYPNSNAQYYWKNNDGADGTYPGDKAANGSGYWQRYLTFEQQFKIQVDKDINALNTVIAATIAAPFGYAFITEGASVGMSSINAQSLDIATKGVLAYYRYAPAAGALGRMVAGFLDESGGVGMTNTSMNKVALGFERNAIALAQEIGGTHLMNTKNWKDAFRAIASDATSELHFSLDDIEYGVSNMINDPSRSSTNWEISTLYTEYYDKFKQTIFHYQGKEYKGVEVFELDDIIK